jgi:hypothetical protein
MKEKELDKYLRLHKLDLTLQLVKAEEDMSIASHTTIICRKTNKCLLDRIIQGIPQDEDILNWLKPIIRQRQISELSC